MDYQASSKILKEKVARIQLPNTYELKSLSKATLEACVGEEASIFGTQNSDVELNKRNLEYLFAQPLHVEFIKVHLTGGLPVKSVNFKFFGTDHNEEPIELKSGLILDNTFEIKVGCFIRGFELISSKQLKKLVKGIECYGYDKASFVQNIEIVKNAHEIVTEIKTKIVSHLNEMDASFEILQTKQTKLADVDSQISLNSTTVNKLQDDILTLEKTAAQRKSDIDSQRESLLQMKKQQEESERSLKEAKEEFECIRTTIREEQRNLNALLEKKSFYNETLVGHKKETSKNILINVVLMICTIFVLHELVNFVMKFYHDTITQIGTIEKPEQLAVIALFRVGAGVLFFYIFRYCFRILSLIFSKTYQLVTDIRNIEGKLVIARAVAETALKTGDFSPEENRNFSAAVSFAVMKNHFLNMSHESIVDDLEVDEAEVEKVMPRIPIGNPLNLLKAARQIPILNTKRPDVIQ